MKKQEKKKMLIFLKPETKEMLRYFSYKKNESQNNLIEKILRRSLKRQLKNDGHYKELSNI
jgi:guanylate kinase